MLDKKFHLELQNVLNTNDEAVLFQGINEDDFKIKGTKPIESFGIFIKDQKDIVLAGISGVTLFGALYLDMLWVHALQRNQGWGSMLVDRAEQLGKSRDCKFSLVNTMDWQALPFYLKNQYVIEFIRTGFDFGAKMYFLRKEL